MINGKQNKNTNFLLDALRALAILLKLVSVKFFGFKVYILIILLGGLFLPMIVLNLLNRIPYIKDIIGVK